MPDPTSTCIAALRSPVLSSILTPARAWRERARQRRELARTTRTRRSPRAARLGGLRGGQMAMAAFGDPPKNFAACRKKFFNGEQHTARVNLSPWTESNLACPVGYRTLAKK